MLTISSGHSVDYLTGAVAAGRENYYTGAVAAGEPPGRWSGRGAARLGLSGLVETQDMTALYERFIDPRDPAFRDPTRWGDPDTATLGHTGRRYLTEYEIYAAALEAEPGADAERRAALLLEAGKRARKNVAFLDATFSVQKSITVLHAAFEAQEVQARSAAERARAALSALDKQDSSATRALGAAGAPIAPPARDGAPSGALSAAPDGALESPPRPGADDGGSTRRRLTADLQAAEAAAAAWGEHRRAVEDAIWAGNQAALDYLADKAGYSRIGHHGGSAGRWIDAHDWTVASFFQHDNRNHDPQLHIHNAILNRVEGADGKWRTIDSRAVHKYRGAAGAVGDRVMEQHLTRSLGVRFATRPDGKAREILGIDQSVLDLFSSRRRAITKKTAELVREFEDKFERSPNALELDRLQRTATFATRKAKSHDGETVEQRLERWDRQLRAEVRGGLSEVAVAVLNRDADKQSLPKRVSRKRLKRGERWRAGEVIETALADVQATKAAWTAPDLTRAISSALPDDLGDLEPAQVARLLDELTEQALTLAVPVDAARPGEAVLPDSLRLADGTPAYQSPGGKLYATPDHIHTERLLATASASASSATRKAPAVSTAAADGFVAQLAEAGLELGADQAQAVRGILTSGAPVETLIGPAGTGKSFVVGALAKAWQDPDLWNSQHRHQHQHSVVGLATSQIATEVLAGEGMTARNIARWLASQARLAAGRSTADDRAWRLRPGDLVVVDESAMTDTTDLARIHQHCQAAGAKLLLTGDHRQLSAVGAGGGMELVAAAGPRHELVETRRFTNAWEGPASLRLRDGDQTVLAEYHKHGRLLDGGAIEQTEAAAARAWLADTLNGQHALLIVDTNEQAARLSAQLRAELVRLGKVDDQHAVPLGMQGTFASRGDLVQARRNAWDLAGYRGNRRAPINRDQYIVLETLPDGGLNVAPVLRRTRDPVPDESMVLPGSYVREHVTLGYASTVHAAQGLTVDVTHVVVTGNTSVFALYVGLSRGRDGNIAYVVTAAVPVSDEAPTGAALQAVHRSPQAVLAAAFETAEDAAASQLSALAQAVESAAEAESVRTPGELFADACELATADRTARWFDQLVTTGHLSSSERVALAVEDGAATLNRLLRRVELAGHDPRQVLTNAITQRSLHDARQITNVLHRRITEHTTGRVGLDPVGDTYADWIPAVDDPQWSAYLTTLAQAADERRVTLGDQAATRPPQWAVEAFGEPAGEVRAQADWKRRVSTVAAYRELVGYDEPDDALGPAPKPGQVEAYAAWRAAWRALGRPEADRAEAEMSNGQLRMRIRAYEREQTWAPPYVAGELAGTRQAADRRRHDAALLCAEADATETTAASPIDTGEVDAADEERRQKVARLRAEAEQAAALADVLDARAAQLAEADQARAEWYAHTAETRAAADRARAELTARQANADQPDEPLVTAEEWLATHDAATRAEDPHRDITTEHELADVAHQRDRDQTSVNPQPEPSAAEPAPLDIRQQTDSNNTTDRPTSTEVDPAAEKHAEKQVDAVRVPSAEETADSVDRARRALLELQRRKAIEDQRTADEAAEHAEQAERDDELARWHSTDQAAIDRSDTTTSVGTAHVDDTGPVLDVAADHD